MAVVAEEVFPVEAVAEEEVFPAVAEAQEPEGKKKRRLNDLLFYRLVG